ncbi:methyl-accepting chemotaxis protein [Aliamphritea spongicola]|uniref:methyl-accepting chemotaxis protein n=1 Tax=Aliamphritea spongicola TaxID=707589 RepID=UPI00196B790A|nr:methyl-accepting chemotaxis protein [Aliamphritea spongicola]MBN3562270.1 methyl-accepting chemotaxis protein [Aliamphritea spongicola]
MFFIRNLPIRVKMTLLVLIPLLLSISYIARDLYGNYEIYKVLEQAEEVSEVAFVGAQLVHELQKERGLTTVHVDTKGKTDTAPIRAQRQSVDNKITEFQAILKADEASIISNGLKSKTDLVIEQLATLGEFRSRVDQVAQVKMKLKESFTFYNDLNRSLLGITAALSSSANDTEISRLASAYYYLLQYKEAGGQERAMLAITFGKDKFKPSSIRKSFNQNLVAQEFYLSTFKEFAPESDITLLNDTLVGPSVDKVAELRELATYQSRSFGVEPKVWVDASTDRINLLYDFEQQIEANLHAAIETKIDAQVAWLSTLVGIAAVALLLTILLSVYLVRLIIKQINLISFAVNRISQHSDLTHVCEAISTDELGGLANEFNQMTSHLSQLTRSVSGATEQITSAVGGMQSISTQVDDRVSEGMRETDSIAVSVQEMSSSVMEVSENCNQAAEQSKHAVEAANEGSTRVNDANQAMGDLNEHINRAVTVINQVADDSSEIGGILDVIKSIAQQTNLLALNAAIEAARAGEQGRGFAVVADEVRNLAQKTQQSTEQIETMIEQLQSGSTEAVKTMEQSHQRTTATMETVTSIQDQLENIIKQVTLVNDMNLQNAAATEEQSATVNEINRNIGMIQEQYNNTNASVSDLRETTESMHSLSDQLSGEVSRFKI